MYDKNTQQYAHGRRTGDNTHVIIGEIHYFGTLSFALSFATTIRRLETQKTICAEQ
jgi:hypothetical protein